MHKLFHLGFGLFFAAVPTSTNYTLKNYDIGGGGTSNSSSTNYRLNATAGSQSSGPETSASYKVGSGLNNGQNANVPPAPTFTNPSTYYDRLKLVINTGSNPSDAKYQVAISDDNFVTTKYVQSDHSVGTNQAISTYQTYASWGSSSGILVLGLNPSTTYKVAVRALQGNFSGSAYGPVATASTTATSLTMSLATTATSTPPFAINFTSLIPNTVANGNTDALIGLTSNANNGGVVYVGSANAALVSSLSGGTIASTTADLSAAASGYGTQVLSTGQTAGGPFTSLSPFNGSSNNVGGLTTTLQPLMSTVGPISGGSGTVRLMAKSASITPSANDYTDTLTFVIAMNY